MNKPIADRRLVETPYETTSAGIAYRALGHGDPMVLLHGGAGNWQHWVRNVDALATRFRVIAIDQPCYGDSSAVPWETQTDVYLDHLFAAVEEMVAGAGRVHVGGFSFGGYLAAVMAVRLGKRTAALSMTGGAGYGKPEGRSFVLDSRKKMRERLGREPTEAETWEMQRDNLGKLMIWDKTKIDDWAVAMQVSNVARTRFDSRRLSWANGTPDCVGRLSCPVMIVYGEHDAASIPPIPDRIARCRAQRPDLVDHIIPDCGHWAMYEAPDVINRLMLQFHGEAA